MSSVLFIDPGGTCAGYAYFEGRVLRAAGLSRPPKALKRQRDRARWHKDSGPMAPYIAICPRVVCECMVHIRKVPPQDLIELNLIVGHIANEWYEPGEWKGSVSREKEQARTMATGKHARLSPEEHAIVMAVKPPSLRHNAISAVGLGINVLGRGWKKVAK